MMSMTTSHKPRKRYAMPVQPFKEILERALIESRVEGLADDPALYRAEGLMTPLQQVSARLCEFYVLNGTTAHFDTVDRKVYDILNDRQKEINFDLADAIVCAFNSPVFFLTDERVKDIYASIGEEE